MDKVEVAGILNNIGAMLELQGENPFKVRAYQNGARVLLTTTEDLPTLVESGRLTEIKGIGQALAEKISILIKTGSLPYYDELRKKIPDGLLELTRVQGLGPKRAMIICEKLGVKDIAGLEKVCREGKVAKLKGFGETVQENILKGITFAAEHQSQHLIDDAEAAADEVLAALKKHPAVKRISVCGSLRRRKEIVRDIDILAACDRQVDAVMKAFVTLPQVTRVLAHGETKSSVIYGLDGMQVDLRIVSDEQFPFALHYFTGSKEHNVAMRHRAIQKKLKLNEYGLFKGSSDAKTPDQSPAVTGKSLKCRDESDLFKALGLAYVPPELREDRGEMEAAEKNRLPRLLEATDLRGVFHVHSTWSDGAVELEEMIAEAQRLGFEYVGISDHSQVATYAHGLSIERLKQQGQVIDALRKKFKIHIFWGSECDILRDGSMDYPDEVLKRFDFVIASVHSAFTIGQEEMTHRVVKALKNKYVTILGHATGRLLLRRSSYEIDLEEVLRVAAAEGVAVEINALPDRLELDWREIPRARELGCRFSCNPDAHSKNDLQGFFRAVDIARKGWCTKEEIVNTQPLAAMTEWLGKRR